MDATSDIRDFRTSRRAGITPEQAGLPAYGRNRAAHNVKFHRTGAKTVHHPVAGDFGRRILVYSRQPGSRSQEALDLLASWASTPASARIDER